MQYINPITLRGFLKNSLLILFALIVNFSFGQKQSKEEKKLLKTARKNLENEKYTDAKINYSDLIKLNPKSDIYNFEGGLSYYFSDFERTKSIPFFENALANSSEDTIPEIQYYLGKAYQLDGQYEKSKQTLNDFTAFIARSKKSGQFLLKETKRNINLSENGIIYRQEQDNNIKIENLGAEINTTSREYAPVFRKDDNVILFTSRRADSKGKTAKDLLPFEDIYAAKKNEDNSWTMIKDGNELKKHLPNNFNTKKHDAGIIYSADGKTLYTYKKDVLWMSEYKDGSWSDLNELSKSINDSKFNVPSISVTQDGNTIFFVATKRDGIGGKDIYKATKNSSGEWNESVLLGTEINTEEDEDAPFLSNDGKTLYFSSKGHKGLGGYDVYKSEIVDGKPTAAVNMGLPLNSSFDDIYLVIDEKDEIGFFSSNRDGGFGGMDIFGFDLSCPNIENTEIRGIVYNKNDKLPLEANLSLVDKETNSTVNETNSLASNGKFLLVAPPEKSYTLTINANGYSEQSISIDIPKQCEFYPLFSEIAIENIEKDGDNYQVTTLRNSYFNSNDAIASAQKNNPIKTDQVENEVPFINSGNDKDFENDKLLIALTRTIDTSNTDLAYIIISDTIKAENINADTSVIEFQQFFAYNITEINLTDPTFISFVKNAIAKVKAFGKIEITIESSASRVPTTTHKTNINLSKLRGEEAKSKFISALKDQGIGEDKILVTAINSIISGPRYIGDFKNAKKYLDSQYVKISVK
ncbi:MAG: hypothetical protein P1U41_06260 [Vicingaceae bacterium]|nr:hypothetical protein [Vicingaceae bacterium]